jgi:hypothetical protein
VVAAFSRLHDIACVPDYASVSWVSCTSVVILYLGLTWRIGLMPGLAVQRQHQCKADAVRH